MVQCFGYGARVSTLSGIECRILLTKIAAPMQPDLRLKALDIDVHPGRVFYATLSEDRNRGRVEYENLL